MWTIRRTGLFCIPRMIIKLLPAGSWVLLSFPVLAADNECFKDNDIVYDVLPARMLGRFILPYVVRRDGVLFLHVEWDRVGRCVPGLCGGRRGSPGGVCGRGADGDVYARRGGGPDVFDTGCE